MEHEDGDDDDDEHSVFFDAMSTLCRGSWHMATTHLIKGSRNCHATHFHDTTSHCSRSSHRSIASNKSGSIMECQNAIAGNASAGDQE